MTCSRVERAACALAVAYVALAMGFVAPADAQYFGRNKVQYRSFDFEVLKTDHFDIYYYAEEKEAAEQAGRMAERWYLRLSRLLDHDLSNRQPLILYASHPHFEQTNATLGEIGESTGGFTEYFKRRIVLPFAGPLGESDHVLGHELVHAFQQDIGRKSRPGSGFVEPAVARLPLWFIEGMAEYLSIGHVDPHTAMWIRDSAIRNRFPTLRKLNDSRYFPYRFGQALWAYVAGRYGDRRVGEIFRAAAPTGDAEKAFERVLGISADSLSVEWHQAIRAWQEPIVATTQPADSLGQLVVGARGERGRLNLSPALSPDGSQMMFLSERDLFSIEMFLADVATGKVLRKVTRTAVDPHFQSLQFIASAGSFSPDGQRFALAAVSHGAPLISIIDVATGRQVLEHSFPQFGEIYTPTWAPNGDRIAFSAIVGGVTDLFVVDVGTGALTRLTEDLYADLAPAWSPDGTRIAFVTDRFTSNLETLEHGDERLALVSPAGGPIEAVPSFAHAKQINPQWSPDGTALYFISDVDGISNVHRVDLATEAFTRVTNVRTGVSGITRLSPALSVARSSGRAVFSVYGDGGYNLYRIDAPEVLAGGPEPSSPDSAQQGAPPVAGLLPPAERDSAIVMRFAGEPTLGLTSGTGFTHSKYKAGLSLDYVAQPSLGVAAGTGGVAFGGGTTLYWSDMLGNHHLATLLQITNEGGSFGNNFAGIVAYENLKSRWNWGITGGQAPYLTRQFEIDEGFIGPEPVVREREIRYWQIDRELVGTVAYPFNSVQRVEFAAGYRNIDFVGEVRTLTYSQVTGALLSEVTERTLTDTLKSLHLLTSSAALVYDTSLFGGTSPVLGQRYRLELSPVVGDIQYLGVLGDVRRYVMPLRPITLAGRVLSFGRYGNDAEDSRLTDLYLGYPWFIHGYDSESFTINECVDENGQPCPTFDRLFGSSLAVANVELRIPLLGGLGIINSPAVPPVEVAGFFDAGVAWTRSDKAMFLGGGRDAVTSHGGALRLNVFGIAVAEFALVHPNDRPRKGWYWQFSLQPGF